MAEFTMWLRDVCSVVDVRKLYLSHYPIHDPDYRGALNDKIIDHYWTREIGQETIDMWGFYLRRKMNEIMPVYNDLYKSCQLKYDPLRTMDMYTVSRGENEATTKQTQSATGETEGKSTSRAIGSTFPQSMLHGDEDYATDGNDAVGTSEGSERNSGESDALSHGKNIADSRVTGRSQSGMQLVTEYRAAIINVDMMIINELEPMFMQVFGNGDFEPGEPYYSPGQYALSPYNYYR